MPASGRPDVRERPLWASPIRVQTPPHPPWGTDEPPHSAEAELTPARRARHLPRAQCAQCPLGPGSWPQEGREGSLQALLQHLEREAGPHRPGLPSPLRQEPGRNSCSDSAPLGASPERGQSCFCGDPFYLWPASLKEHRKAKACNFLVMVKITFLLKSQQQPETEKVNAHFPPSFSVFSLKKQTQKALLCAADRKAGRGNPLRPR